MNLAEAGLAMGCPPPPVAAHAPLPTISTDSRKARPGQLFFALRGERLDGHDFIQSALERGVCAVVHSGDWRPAAGSPVIDFRVADTTRALQDLAARVRQKWNGRVVAVTGSMGKTTTRQFTAHLLAQRYRVHQSRGNLNNHFGVPLSLLELEPEHQVAVLELGMNHAGEISRLAEVCAPDVGVITNVAPAHLEFFSDLEEIAAAKGELLQHLGSGTFIFNADDPRVCRLAGTFAGPVRGFGFSEQASVRIVSFRYLSLSETRFELSLEGESLSGQVPFVGRHFLYNLAAAVAVSRHFGLTSEQIRRGIRGLEAASNRGRICRVSDGRIDFDLWDDSYNANPRAVQSMLETLSGLPVAGRRVVVLGDMLELGVEAALFHREAGRTAAECGVDLLLAVGPLSREIAAGAIAAGLDQERVFHFADSASAAEWLRPRVELGDLILVKGSRGIAAETVVKRLTEGREVQDP